MMEKQMKLGMAALEFDVMFDTAKKEYVAWYYEILNQDTMKEVVNDAAENDRR